MKTYFRGSCLAGVGVFLLAFSYKTALLGVLQPARGSGNQPGTA